MTNAIPVLWPTSQLKVDVRSPLAILRGQIPELEKLTQGILRAKIEVSETEEKKVRASMDILAPLLQYRHRLVEISYDVNFYPVEMSAAGLIQRKMHSVPVSSLIGTPNLVDKEVLVKVEKKTAYTEEEFIEILREALSTPQTIAMLQSLIAKSNETREPSLPIGT